MSEEPKMAMNKVQFQKGLSVEKFLKKYGTEEQCEDALVAQRWPLGYECPKCQCKRFSMTHNGRRLWECLDCKYQCSAIAGTVMQATKLPLRTWFLAMYFMTQSKNAIAALELKRQLGVSYKTAWMMKHKLQEVMAQQESTRKLECRVEIDDAYLGGERTGGKVGRGSENKIPFVAAVQTNKNGAPIYVRFDMLKSFKTEDIQAWAKVALACSARVVSDGMWGFQGVVAQAGVTHTAHITGHGKKAAMHPQFRWVNTLLGNLKTSLSGTFHAFKFAKYARHYLAEFQYRFNRRLNLAAMLPQLLAAIVLTKPQKLSILRSSELCS
jgi:ribosomal protein L37AE/L43A